MMDHYNKPYEYKFLPWEKNVNSKTEYLPLYTNIAPEFVNITQDVRRFVEESKIKEGICLVITASIYDV